MQKGLDKILYWGYTQNVQTGEMFMRLSTTEQTEYERLKADGWTVYRNGWPDFLAEKDGKFRLIEVKSGDNKLSINQKKMCHALHRLTGLMLEVRQYGKTKRGENDSITHRIKSAFGISL
jgi:hypothetical protein